MFKLLLALAVFAPISSSPVEDPVDLVWKPKTDQKIAYAMTMEMSAAEHTMKASVDLTLTVKKVAEDGSYDVEASYENNKVVADGAERAGPNSKQLSKYDVRGHTIRPKDQPEPPKSLISMADFESPDKAVKTGDTWTRSEEADDKTGRPAYKVTSTYMGLDKFQGVDAYRVKVNATIKSEPTQSVEAIYYLSVTDGSMVRIEIDSEDPSNSSNKMKMRVTRKDLVKS